MLPVFYETRQVGTIEPGDGGPVFRYDAAWLDTAGAFPISTSMPLSEPVVGPDRLVPWIANLLPENAQLSAVSFNLQLAPQDILGILAAIGRDTAGALSFKQRGATRPEWRSIPDEAALERIINELPAKPFLVGEEGVSMSLAGGQSKLGVVLDADGRIHIPINGSPSTHILKPDNPRLPGGVHNEAVCMALARQCGLAVPDIVTGRAGHRAYFLIRRYDRESRGEHCRRIHQEDFCQALGYFPASKYERNQTGVPGPHLPHMFDLIRSRGSIADVPRLLDYVIFNIICCNTDAHAKNYALAIRASGATLAPIYDVMCGAVWPNVARNLAHSIDAKTRGDHLKARHWQREAINCGLNPRLVLARVEAMANTVLAQIDTAMQTVAALPAGAHPVIADCEREISKRARHIIAGLRDLGDADGESPEDVEGVSLDAAAS